jgi:recombination protein RecA
LDLAVELDILDKRGSYYAYNGENLAQGRENTKELLAHSPDLAAELEARIRETMMTDVEASQHFEAVNGNPIEDDESYEDDEDVIDEDMVEEMVE